MGGRTLLKRVSDHLSGRLPLLGVKASQRENLGSTLNFTLGTDFWL